MAKQQNPFRTTMVRMVGGPDAGNCISVAGFTLFAEDDGSFEVPAPIAVELRSHGFTEAPARAPAPPPKKDGEGDKK